MIGVVGRKNILDMSHCDMIAFPRKTNGQVSAICLSRRHTLSLATGAGKHMFARFQY
jgi:hypothetical protein